MRGGRTEAVADLADYLASTPETVPIPLLADDADVPLDLPRALTAVYDASIEYAKRAEIPLSKQDDVWP